METRQHEGLLLSTQMHATVFLFPNLCVTGINVWILQAWRSDASYLETLLESLCILERNMH